MFRNFKVFGYLVNTPPPPLFRGEVVVFPLYQEGIKGCVIIRKSRCVLLCKTQLNLIDRNFNLLESEMLHFVQHDNKVILSGAKNLIYDS